MRPPWIVGETHEDESLIAPSEAANAGAHTSYVGILPRYLLGLKLQPGHSGKRNVFCTLRRAHDRSQIFGRHEALWYAREEKARENRECNVQGERSKPVAQAEDQ